MTTGIAAGRSFKQTELISYGAAMLGIDMVWATITAFLPPMLERFGASPAVIGILMSIGPAAGLFVQPLAGLFSDRAQTRLGRRLPFILMGVPLAILSLLGLGFTTTLGMAAIFTSLLCIAVNFYQGPYRAILGDEIAPEQHSLASSFMNLFSGLGLILAFTLGAQLSKRDGGLPFCLTALMVFVTSSWTCRAVSKLRSSHSISDAEDGGLIEYLKGARDLWWLFGAQFCWWFAIQAASTFAVLFTVHDLKGIHDIASSEGRQASADAVLLLATVTITVMLAAVPAGLLAQRYGKKQILSIGLFIMMIGFLVIGFIATGSTPIYIVYLGMMMFGLGFASVQVIPFTILTQLQPKGREGALAGVFSVFVALPQLLSVTIVGALIDRTGSYRLAFMLGSGALLLAFIILQAIKLPATKR